MMDKSALSFITYNVKGIRFPKKRAKIFEYLKGKVLGNGFLFLQETHSTKYEEEDWRKELSKYTFFSH